MSTETTTTTTTAGIALSDVAAQKVSSLLKQEGRDDLSLRVAVQPGGCSGLRYQLYFDDRALDGDTITEFGAEKVKVVTDKMSTPYLMGATIDFVDIGAESRRQVLVCRKARRWQQVVCVLCGQNPQQLRLFHGQF